MKTKKMLWAALSMTAALMMTACSSSDDNETTETPQTPSTTKIIPYTVTIYDGGTTRATVGNDLKTLYFAEGDKLYITGTNIYGVLENQSGGNTSSVTFSGNLYYEGSGDPAENLELTATLVSAQQENTSKISVNNGAVTVNYPNATYCSSVNEAVQEYSNLTGTSTYGAKSFSLSQQTAFLNFEITFEDATTAGTELSAVVSNDGETICTANVSTEIENEKVVAKFVLPVAKGTTLSSATVKMGNNAAISFGAGQILDGKVYNAKKIQYMMAANATDADKGKLICTAGHIHTYGADAACTKNRVAKIIYVGSDNGVSSPYNHGLALALTDEESTMTWEEAKTACSTTKNTNTPVTDASWMLASQAQWEKMGVKSDTYEYLRDSFTSVGGENMQTDSPRNYWSSLESNDFTSNGQYAMAFYSYAGVGEGNSIWSSSLKSQKYWVRACLAF